MKQKITVQMLHAPNLKNSSDDILIIPFSATISGLTRLIRFSIPARSGLLSPVRYFYWRGLKTGEVFHICAKPFLTMA